MHVLKSKKIISKNYFYFFFWKKKTFINKTSTGQFLLGSLIPHNCYNRKEKYTNTVSFPSPRIKLSDRQHVVHQYPTKIPLTLQLAIFPFFISTHLSNCWGFSIYNIFPFLYWYVCCKSELCLSLFFPVRGFFYFYIS